MSRYFIILLTKKGKKIDLVLDPHSHILHIFWGYRWDLEGVYCSNVPFIFNPCKFQEFAITGKKLPSQKPKRILAKIGQNLIRIEISWGSAVEIVKIGPTVFELSVEN